MTITTRGRYATRALIELALESGNRPKGIRAISEAQEIPVKYLETLFRSLKATGLVRSVRGASGGYRLGRKACAITVLDVVTAVESSLETVECTSRPEVCPRSAACVTRDLWQRLDSTVSGILAEVTVADLAGSYVQRQQAQAHDFSI